ncbi:MAG: LamG domain-containing protein [Syntrophaceae bacterium]|nr:LamG domain-containing protein [Syntrophaceae bacterium]
MIILTACYAFGEDFNAYYTKLNSGQEFEKYTRTGPYADVVVELEQGQLIFWRASSYLPHWKTDQGSWYLDEIIERSGDGPEERPDRVNTYSHIRIGNDGTGGEKIVIHWRYLPKFGSKNPHNGLSPTRFVDEYFHIHRDGRVDRIIKLGTKKYRDWLDPHNQYVQKLLLKEQGIEVISLAEPGKGLKSKTVTGNPIKKSDVGEPVITWHFDEGIGDATQEALSKADCEIEGPATIWKKGISGTALQFDGYNTVIELNGEQAPELMRAVTLEGWMAIGAYPWNDAPVVQRGVDGYWFLGLGAHGNPIFKIIARDQEHKVTADVVLERNRWYHLAGTYDPEQSEMRLFVNGEQVGSAEADDWIPLAGESPIFVGQGKAMRPTDPVRRNTFVCNYSFDGLIDEVKIYDALLTPEQVATAYRQIKPADEVIENPDMDYRLLPDTDVASFGGYYRKLDFYESWDKLWRFGDYADVVVGFDDQPCQFVFWRGTGYIPMIVNEKDQWWSNEFNETWNKSGGKGCQEPMSDKEAYSNRARIIENTEARVVVHWRYPLKDVLHTHANYVEETGWSDWSDWYYYIYPDGVAAKLMHLWTSGERNHEFIEGMAIYGPNQHPEDVIKIDPAVYLSDTEGNVDIYDWVDGPPDDTDYENKKIILINYKAKYKPFTIGDFTKGDVYGGEVTDYAVFPAWNHWPVSQIPSDGRYASFPDRTGHSSLTDGLVWQVHEEAYGAPPDYNYRHFVGPETKTKSGSGDRPYYSKILLEGMTDRPAGELASLARSWLNPAEINTMNGCSSSGYDKAQRAYVLEAEGDRMTFELEGSSSSPVVNPCFVISNWKKEEAKVTVSGQEPEDIRIGHPRTVTDKDMVIWIKMQSENKVKIVIDPAE